MEESKIKRFQYVVKRIGELRRKVRFEIDPSSSPERIKQREEEERDLDYLIAERNQMLGNAVHRS